MPSLNLIGNLNLTGNNKYNRNPFIAAGGVMNTFTSGGVNYTSHTFISGSGSFTILNGETTAQVLVVGGGGGGTGFGQQLPRQCDFWQIFTGRLVGGHGFHG